VLILEKAWAKVYGNYQRIEAGLAGEAMYPLTGCPQYQFFHDDVRDIDRFWTRIITADKKGFPMCCCTFSSQDNDVTNAEVTAAGLQDSHAYTLIGAYNIVQDDLKEVRLLKVRNPYGMKEWQGDWGDNSKKWTVRCRNQVNGENKNDGIFFMTLADFMKFFTATTICCYLEN